MILSTNLSSGLPIFKAFSSPVRISIYQLIRQEPGINVSSISKKLQIPPSTLTPHLQSLKDAGLIVILDNSNTTIKHCFIKDETTQLSIDVSFFDKNVPSIYRCSIPVGGYMAFDVTPPCALASKNCFLGLLDEPRYFSQLGRTAADILWFNTGYVEYALPNFIPLNSKIKSLSLSFEIASEAPQTNNNYPSDITFSLNGIPLGTWTSPGDYGDRRGKLNPFWWFSVLNQYGMLKKLIINEEGTFLDDEKLSNHTIQALKLTPQSPWKLRFSVDPESKHPGGCTLFGKSFGDHQQDLLLEIAYFVLD